MYTEKVSCLLLFGLDSVGFLTDFLAAGVFLVDTIYIINSHSNLNSTNDAKSNILKILKYYWLKTRDLG
jgi:hypothetical protein